MGLRLKLTQYFSDDELRTLCVDLEVDYESLPGQGKEGKARELIAHLQRRDLLPGLIAKCGQQRPNVSWDDAPEVSPPMPLLNIPSGYTVAAQAEVARFTSDVQKQVASAESVNLEIQIWRPTPATLSAVDQKRQDIYDQLAALGHAPRFVDKLAPFEQDHSRRLAQLQAARQAQVIIIVLEDSPAVLADALEFCSDTKIAPSLLICLPKRYEKKFADRQALQVLEGYRPVFWYSKTDVTACNVLKQALQFANGKRIAKYLATVRETN